MGQGGIEARGVAGLEVGAEVFFAEVARAAMDGNRPIARWGRRWRWGRPVAGRKGEGREGEEQRETWHAAQGTAQHALSVGGWRRLVGEAKGAVGGGLAFDGVDQTHHLPRPISPRQQRHRVHPPRKLCTRQLKISSSHKGMMTLNAIGL